MNDTQHYSERAFAFLDILGFSDVISQMDDKPDLFEKIKSVLEFAINTENLNYKNNWGRRLSTLEIISFSDCIVISAPKEDLYSVIFKAKLIAREVFSSGFLCRGGITVGNGYHQNRIAFGQGFNDAYELEKSVAIYPRIVVSDVVVTLLKQWGENQRHFKFTSILKQDVDGCWFVDLFSYPWVCNQRYKFFQTLKATITKGVECKKLNVAGKYWWLANQVNEFIEVDGEHDLKELKIILNTRSV